VSQTHNHTENPELNTVCAVIMIKAGTAMTEQYSDVLSYEYFGAWIDTQ